MNYLKENKIIDSFQVIESLSDPIIIIDKTSHEIIFINYEGEITFEKSKKNLEGKKIQSIIGESSLVYSFILNSLAKTGNFIYNEVILNIKKKRRFFNLEVINNLDLEYLIVILKNNKDEIKKRLELQSNEDLINNVVFNIIKILKNPLSSIKGAMQLVEKNIQNFDDEIISLILFECNKVINTIQLLENNNLNLQTSRSNENIHKIIREIILKNKNKNISYIEDFDPSLPLILINREQIKLSIENIIKNSQESINSNDGKIKITTKFSIGNVRNLPNINKKENNNYLEIIIEDNGQGIKDEIFNNIFFPFFTTKNKSKGFGLYVSKRIINEHSGEISFKSQGNTTKFMISLPI